ncbi:MAG: preprotein translocase subunit SecE [Steroidobacteraceae bacterium]
MNEQAQEQNAGAGAVGLVTIALAVALVIAGIAGYYLMDARPDWQRWSAAGLGLVAGLAVFAASPMGRRSWQFALDSRVELRKVVWPSRQETLQTTLAVFLFVTVAGLFFWLLDAILAWVTKLLTGQGG